MRRRDFCLGRVAMPALARSAFGQEAGNILFGKQYGLPYLPLMVMEELRLVEKHAAKAGLTLTPEYKTLGGTATLIDALISGQMTFGVTGTPGLVTLWDKTVGTQNEVRALSAVQSMPFRLITNQPHIKSIRDFTEKDKIALPAIKVSAQAICLQMAAAKEWGQDQFAKLDPLTITRAHPDAATAIMSKSQDITAHYTVAPFFQYELGVPGTHTVLKSYDAFEGPKTNGVMIMTKKFRDANPKICTAVYAALDEAEVFITKNARDAAAIYQKMTNEKRSSLEELTQMIADPDNRWTTVPEKVTRFAAFMHRVGSVKKLPADWRDLFMPEAQGLAGS